VALLLAYIAGGFLGLVLLAAGVGANVWWLLTQRPYSLVLYGDTGGETAGRWTGSDASQFVDRVIENVRKARQRAQVRHRILSEKRPFARFGGGLEERLEMLRKLVSSGRSDEVRSFADALIDEIGDNQNLQGETLDEALASVTEVVAIGADLNATSKGSE
jgi:hypothetical protein